MYAHTAIICYLAGWWFTDYWLSDTNYQLASNAYSRFSILYSALCFIGVASLIPGVYADAMLPTQIIRVTTCIYLLYFAAVIDFKTRLIPNRIPLFMFVVAACTYIAEYKAGYEESLFPALLGTLWCFLCFMTLWLLAHGGFGFGDVKLLTVMGFTLGYDDIMEVLIWSCIIAVAVFLILVIAKKMGLRDALPLAPFFFIGTLLKYALGW